MAVKSLAVSSLVESCVLVAVEVDCYLDTASRGGFGLVTELRDAVVLLGAVVVAIELRSWLWVTGPVRTLVVVGGV